MIKKIVLILIFVTITYHGVAQKKNKDNRMGYEIDVKLKSTPPDTMFYLISYYGEFRLKIDSAYSKPTQRDRFKFKGDTILPSGIYLIVNQRKIQLVEFVVDKSQKLYLEFDTLNTISNVIVKYSPETQLFYTYLKTLTSKQDSVREIEKVLDYAHQTQNRDLFDQKYPEYVKRIELTNEYTASFVNEHPQELIAKVLKMNRDIEMPPLPSNPDGTKDSTWGWYYFKSHYWDNVDLVDVRMYRTPVFGSKLKTFFQDVIYQHPDSINSEVDHFLLKTNPSKEMTKIIITWFLDYYQQSQMVMHEAVFVHLVEKYVLNDFTPWMSDNMKRIFTKRAAQLKSIIIGSKIPELVMEDTSGVLLSNYNTGSKYTIMWFWDPDCTHCAIETPKLLDFYHSYGRLHGVEVFSVSLDSDMNRWKTYIKEHNLDWINVGGAKANIDYVMTFDVISTPVIYVFDHNKRIIAKNIPIENLKEVIEKYEQIFNFKK